MKVVYVRDLVGKPYAELICSGRKRWETRSRNTLSSLLGERVLIARTSSHKRTEIIGACRFTCPAKLGYEAFRAQMNMHLVPPGSKFDCKPGSSKWCYRVDDPELFGEPIPMPRSCVRHGMTWAEVELNA